MSREILDDYLCACSEWLGGEPTGVLLDASRALMSLGDATLLQEAVDRMPTLPPAGAAWVAVTCGSAVEDGAPLAERTGPAIFALFTSWLPQLPDDEERLAAFPLLCNAVVSHLARLPAQREAMRNDDALVERVAALQNLSEGATWVFTALMKTSGTLRVLHPASAKGFRLRYENIANCFQLFSLVQAAIGKRLPGGRNPDGIVAEVVRGQRSQPVSDAAWWHYGSPESPTPTVETSIWGEPPVDTIPEVDGERLILLWAPLAEPLQWNSAFLTPHLEAMPADLRIAEELDPAECRTLMEQLGIRPDAQANPQQERAAEIVPPQETRKWWKPW